MDKQKIAVRTFRFAMGTTVTYWNSCGKCHEELDEPTKSGMLTCPQCGEKTLLSLLGNKF